MNRAGKTRGNAMRLTFSFRDLETLSTHELHQLYADLLEILRHDELAPQERKQAQALAGSIRFVLNRRLTRQFTP